jgi:hypothetical protein
MINVEELSIEDVKNLDVSKLTTEDIENLKKESLKCNSSRSRCY